MGTIKLPMTVEACPTIKKIVPGANQMPSFIGRLSLEETLNTVISVLTILPTSKLWFYFTPLVLFSVTQKIQSSHHYRKAKKNNIGKNPEYRRN